MDRRILMVAAIHAVAAGVLPMPDRALAQEAAFDAAPFGSPTETLDGRSFGRRWAQPRKIRRIEVDWPPGAVVPAPDKVRVEYWHGHWDGRPDPILSETGAGGFGWVRMDDWTNGQWKQACAVMTAAGDRWTVTFEPTDGREFEKLKTPGVAYRRTLMLRLIADEPMPEPTGFRVLTDSVRRPLTVRIEFGRPREASIRLDREDSGRLTVFNGRLLSMRPIAGGELAVEGEDGWKLPPAGCGGVQAEIEMAVDPVSGRYDHTVVTVHSQIRPFSFAADEVARGDRILVDDLGALVTRGDDAVTLEAYRAALREFPGRTVYDRVFDEPEQTLARAWNDMPLKRPLYFVHGLPGNRNAMRQDPDGDIGVTNHHRWFRRNDRVNSPRDAQRKGWEGDMLQVRLGLPAGAQRGGRELLEGYLPQLRTWWQDGPVYYELSTVMDKLEGRLEDLRLDDPTVLLGRWRVVNTSADRPAGASLTFRTEIKGGPKEKLVLDGHRLLAEREGGPALRLIVRPAGGELRDGAGQVTWTVDLPPGGSQEAFLAVPSVTLTDPAAIQALAARDFQADSRRVCDFWRTLTDRTARIETPEPWLNDFYRAHLRHLQVNCLADIEPQTRRRYAHVGTFEYGVYANESVMMITDLDRRGEHEAAEQCYQTFLDFQGTVPLPGNFKTTDGLFYGADGQEAGGYNKHHGYVLWGLAEHWWFTRDRAWMERAAPKLVRGCDWVTRERQGTMVLNPDGSRPIEWGCLPAGGLEDVQDYWYWLATNSSTVWGFENLASALADFGHPEAPRLVADAAAYRQDVIRALHASRIAAPVVRLRDARYVPKYPSELYERGRCVGWLRETLEGAVFLPFMGLLAAEAPETRWILQDYEDNLYISDRYGYAIPNFDAFWFSRGGFSMQANLLDGPMPYLYRDEIKHFLRAYFNAFASAFYPEIRMCNEHSLPELGYPAGDHFKSSDEAQSTWWLRLMFIHERGGDLYLGQALPRYWLSDGRTVGIERAATHYGPMSLKIASNAAAGRIVATLTPPSRNPPRNIYLRFRHPEGRRFESVTLNGQPYDRFDTAREWVILPGTLAGPQEIAARY